MPPRIPLPTGLLRPQLAAPSPVGLLRALFSCTAAVQESNSTRKLLNMTRKAVVRRTSGLDPAQRSALAMAKMRNRVVKEVKNKEERIAILHNLKMSNSFLKQMPRRFQDGELYAPHDLSPVEMHKWRKKSTREGDVIDALGVRPLDMYSNFTLISDFTSTSGQIAHSSVTGLRPPNQRKIAKMIRRAQGMGIYPSCHDHPEILRQDYLTLERRLELAEDEKQLQS